jgi:hypothetical protein
MSEEPKGGSHKKKADQGNSEKAAVTLPGVIDKVIPSVIPSESERAQITVEGADHLYREIRVENTLQDANGEKVSLKVGAEVEVTIEADKDAVKPAVKSSKN